MRGWEVVCLAAIAAAYSGMYCPLGIQSVHRFPAISAGRLYSGPPITANTSGISLDQPTVITGFSIWAQGRACITLSSTGPPPIQQTTCVDPTNSSYPIKYLFATTEAAGNASIVLGSPVLATHVSIAVWQECRFELHTPCAYAEFFGPERGTWRIDGGTGIVANNSLSITSQNATAWWVVPLFSTAAYARLVVTISGSWQTTQGTVEHTPDLDIRVQVPTNNGTQIMYYVFVNGSLVCGERTGVYVNMIGECIGCGRGTFQPQAGASACIPARSCGSVTQHATPTTDRVCGPTTTLPADYSVKTNSAAAIVPYAIAVVAIAALAILL